MIQAFPQLLNYVHVTVLITVISAILGVILGSIIAIIRPQEGTSIKPIFIVFISLYARVRRSWYSYSSFTLGCQKSCPIWGLTWKMCQASYSCMPCLLCILQRIALKSCAPVLMRLLLVRKEAAKSLGMTEFQSYGASSYRRLSPWAFHRWRTSLSACWKGTALIFNVGVVDMMRKADLMGGNSQRYLELFVDAAIIYGILIIIVSLWADCLKTFSPLRARKRNAFWSVRSRGLWDI